MVSDGSPWRPIVHLEDIIRAVYCTLEAPAGAVNGEVFNVGGAEQWTHADLVTLLVSMADGASYEFVEWPAEKKAIDIGSFYADSSKFMQATGWAPTVGLREGLARTLAFYRANYAAYVNDGTGA